MKVVRIKYDCEKCGKECCTTTHNLRYRTHRKDERICQRCLIKLEKSAAVFQALPECFHYQVFKNAIDYDVAFEYLLNVTTKSIVTFKCKECKEDSEYRWSDAQRRKHQKCVDICLECLNHSIQNEPSKLLSNSNKSKQLWKDERYQRQCLKAFSDHNKRMQLEPEYALKHRRRSNSVVGQIELNGAKIQFDSGFELIYLWYVKDRCDHIRRCDFSIAYGGHFYHPDFLVVSNGVRTIVEIKGYYRNNVPQKQAAAERYISETNVADAYVLYDADKLVADGILIGIGGGNMWKQIREINNEAIVTFADPKHKRIAEIGISRYRRETKHNKNCSKATRRQSL